MSIKRQRQHKKLKEQLKILEDAKRLDERYLLAIANKRCIETRRFTRQLLDAKACLGALAIEYTRIYNSCNEEHIKNVNLSKALINEIRDHFIVLNSVESDGTITINLHRVPKVERFESVSNYGRDYQNNEIEEEG